MPETCILHLSFDLPPDSIWGMANAVYSLAKAQSEHRRVCIAVPHGGCRTWKPEAPAGSASYLSIVRHNVALNHLQAELARGHKHGISSALLWNEPFADYLASRLSDMNLQPEIVHFHGWMMFPASANLATRFGCPLIYTAHTVEGYYEPNPDHRPSGSKEIEAMIFGRSTAVIAPSESARNVLALGYLGTGTKLYLIPNPLTSELAESGDMIPFSQRRNQITWVGRVVRHKGIIEALKLFIELALTQKSWTLLVIGDGPDLKPIQDTYGGVESIQFTGFQPTERVFSHLRKSKVFLSLSHFETFGMSVAEAMYLGCCIVTSDSPQIAKLVEHNVSGFSVGAAPPLGVGALGCKRQLVALFNDDERMERLGSAARSYARSAFDPQVIGRQHLDVYHDVKAQSGDRFDSIAGSARTLRPLQL